jgi:hypothetical protein
VRLLCNYVSDNLGGFRLLSLDGREAPPTPGSVYQSHVTSFDFTPDGRRLVMNRGGYSCNRVECWEIRPPELFAPLWSILDGEPINPDEPFLLNQATWFTNGVAISPDRECLGQSPAGAVGRASGPDLAPHTSAGPRAHYRIGNSPIVRFRPLRFRPTFDKWSGESCGGVFLHVTDPEAFRPYRTTVALLAAVRVLHPQHFRWLDPPYEYETQKLPIEILSGSSRLRETLEMMTALDQDAIDSLCRFDESAWRRRCEPFLLYQ